MELPESLTVVSGYQIILEVYCYSIDHCALFRLDEDKSANNGWHTCIWKLMGYFTIGYNMISGDLFLFPPNSHSHPQVIHYNILLKGSWRLSNNLQMVTIASRLKYKCNMYMEIINLYKCQSSVSDILFMYYLPRKPENYITIR